jgi:hypothetical protein
MLDAHEQMFGEAGRQCAEIVLRWATTLFAVPLAALNVRIVLAPVELGPYNRHTGYHYGRDSGTFVLANRHIVKLQGGTLVLVQDGAGHLLRRVEDFIVHELTHARQAQLEAQHGWTRKRGDHRDKGWYAAIAEACPNYLGVEFPLSSWPKGPRPKKGTNPLTEVEGTHWPGSFRELAMMDDPRLPKCTSAIVQQS